MDKMYICPICKKPVRQSESVHISKRYYHKKCQENEVAKIAKRIKEKKATKLEIERYTKISKGNQPVDVPAAVSEREAADKGGFFDKLISIVGECNSKDRVLAERLKNEYEEFTWEGMTKTLTYCFGILGMNVTEDKNSVGILPWYYNEAQNFYEQLDNIEPEKKSLEQMYKRRKVKISSKKSDVLIDIDEIGE